MKTALLAIIFAASAMTTLHAEAAPADSTAADHAQIQQLVDHFKGAIIAKDGQAMRSFFLPGGSWMMGLDKASLAKVRTKKPGAPQFMPDNYQKFADFVGSAPKPIEEVFDNVHIDTDGVVGIVYFNYRFLVEGKPTNHGVETWQVVHTDQGWKISAMLYSAILDGI